MQCLPAIGVPPAPPIGVHAELPPKVRSIWQSLPPPRRMRLIQTWRRLLQQHAKAPFRETGGRP